MPGALVITGSLNVNFGTDAQNRSFSFAPEADQPTLTALTSDGQAVHLFVTTVGGLPTMIGYVGTDPLIAANQVFTVSLDANSTIGGTYTFTLLRPLDHPIQGTEDTLNLVINVIATDGSGDTTPVTIPINVNDDTAVIVAANETHSTLTDPLLFTSGDAGRLARDFLGRRPLQRQRRRRRVRHHRPDRRPLGGVHRCRVELTGDLQGRRRHAAQHRDADLARRRGAFRAAQQRHRAGGLYRRRGAGPARHGGGGSEGGDGPQVSPNIVFIVTLSDASDSGSYVITQYQPLDHNAGAQTFNSIDLSFHFTATDIGRRSGLRHADRDHHRHRAGEHRRDRRPRRGRIRLPARRPAIETAVPVGGFVASSTGDVSLNIDWGADNTNDATAQPGDRSVAFTQCQCRGGERLIGATLTSLGQDVHFALLVERRAGRLYRRSSVPTSTGDANVVFFATLTDASARQLRLHAGQAARSRPRGNGENSLSLTFNYTATDTDGDTSSSTFTVNVVDDVPTAGSRSRDGLVEEEQPVVVGAGNEDNGGADDADFARRSRSADLP